MRFQRQRGSTSNIVEVFVPDNSSTTGAGISGLSNASTNLQIAYKRELDAAFTTYTGANIETITTIGTFANPSSSAKVRFKEVDAVNAKGLYQMMFHDSSTIFGSGDASQAVVLNIVEVTTTALKIGPNMALIPMVPWNPQDAVRQGMTALPNAAAAAANGLPVLGTNAPAISFTGGVTISNASGDALALTSSGGNGAGLNASGNGTSDGIKATGGATGRGIHAVGGATSGAGIRAEAQGGNSLGIHGLGINAGAGMRFEGGATGPGVLIVGGATSGDGIDILTTAGDGLSILPTAGNAIVATGNGTSKHGVVVTGGTAGTSDGLKAVAGTGGVPIRGDITGNIHGTLDTLTTYTGNTPQTGDSFARIGAPAGASASADIAAVKVDTAANRTALGVAGAGLTAIPVIAAVTTVTNLTNAPTSGDFTAAMKTSLNASTPASVVGAVGSVTARVTANADQFAGQPITAAAGVTLPSSVASPTNITAGTITTVTNLTNAPSAGDFTSTMKSSLNASTPAVTVADKTGYALTAAYDAAKTASQAGDAMALTSGERTTLAGIIWANATRTLSSFGTLVSDSAAAVWAAGARTLTGFGFTVATNSDTNVTAIKAKTDNLPASPAATGAAMTLTSAYDAAKTAAQPSDVPTAASNAAALLDGSDGVETSWSVRQSLRMILSALAALLSGAQAGAGTIKIRDINNSKDRITADVDANGNRTAIVYDKS